MMLRQNLLKFYAMGLVASVMGMASCQDEPERVTLQDSATITEEAVTDSYFQDMDDMAGVAVASPTETEYSGGRTSGTIVIQDHRFQCESIIVTLQPDAASTREHPKGILTVDFGVDGCKDLRQNTRKGKLIFTYDGPRFTPGSTVVTTTENYSINGVTLEGTRTLTNVQSSTTSAPRFNVVLADGRATFSDEKSVTRNSDITWQWNRAENPLEDNLQIEMTSTASGTTRAGKTYEVSILEDLVYQRHCGIAVSGVKKYIIDGTKEITIDYGDGTCDRALTVTVNGVAHEITL